MTVSRGSGFTDILDYSYNHIRTEFGTNKTETYTRDVVLFVAHCYRYHNVGDK
jgi:hypothetical protein